MSVKTDIQLKSDNTILLSKIDNRYNHLTTLKTLIDDVVDSKETLLGNPSVNGYILSSTTTGTRSWIAIPGSVVTAALTKTDDTNVTLTLGGTPTTALLQNVSLTLGWVGTLADSRIASASTWNGKQNAVSLTTIGTSGIATFNSGTGVLNIPNYATGGSPTLTTTYIGFGDGSNLLSGSSTFTYNTGTITNSGSGASFQSTATNSAAASDLRVINNTGSQFSIVQYGTTNVSTTNGFVNAGKSVINTVTDLLLSPGVSNTIYYGGGAGNEWFSMSNTLLIANKNLKLLQNGGSATNTVTQKSSFKQLFESSLWSGASESKNTFEIYSRASNSVNNESHLAFSYNNNDFLRIKNDGKIWNIPGLIPSGKFSITSSDSIIAIFDNTNCGFGYNIFNSSYSGNFNFAFGSGSGSYLTTGSRNTLIGSTYAWQITSGNDNLVIGSYTTGNANVTGSGNIVLNTGLLFLSSGNFNVNIGLNCTTSTPTVSNEFNIGSTNGGFTTANILNQSISVVNIGNGGKNDLYNGTNVLLRVTPVTTVNNTIGGHLSIGAGGSTGSALGGSIFLQTTPPGASGNLPNALVTVQTIDEKGNIGFNGTQFGSGVKVTHIGNASTIPTTNPTTGIIHYAESGVWKYRDINGFIITV